MLATHRRCSKGSYPLLYFRPSQRRHLSCFRRGCTRASVELGHDRGARLGSGRATGGFRASIGTLQKTREGFPLPLTPLFSQGRWAVPLLDAATAPQLSTRRSSSCTLCCRVFHLLFAELRHRLAPNPPFPPSRTGPINFFHLTLPLPLSHTLHPSPYIPHMSALLCLARADHPSRDGNEPGAVLVPRALVFFAGDVEMDKTVDVLYCWMGCVGDVFVGGIPAAGVKRESRA